MMQTKTYYLTRLPMIEEPYISPEDMANVRNEHAHRMSCQKARKKRKKRRK